MIIPGTCLAYLIDVHNGVHRPEHEYRCALYGRGANLSPRTPSYTSQGEVSGQGYEAGGIILSGRVVALHDEKGCLDFEGFVIPLASIGAAGGLIYNDSVPRRPAIAVISFGSEIIATAGPFRVELPEPGPDTSLVRFAG